MAFGNKANTPSFVVERKMYLKQSDYCFLEKIMNVCNKMYNTGVKHYLTVLNTFHSDARFLSAFNSIKELLDKRNSISDNKELNAELKLYYKSIDDLIKEYGLKEKDIHQYFCQLKNRSYQNCLSIDIIQKLGSELYQAIEDCIYSLKKTIHYRKRGQTTTISGKKNGSGIKYDPATDTVYFDLHFKRKATLKTIRQKDVYLKEAMLNKVKYCRIVRKPFGKQYRYFVQLVMEGKSPKKLRPVGKGTVGVDPGVSIVAYSNDKTARFVQLAEGVERYDKQLKKLSRQVERSLRLNNPDCYDENGVAIKGKKPTNYTNGYCDAIMKLKTVYRKRSEFILLSHRTLANQIASIADTVIIEPMDFKALQKRIKQTQRQENPSVIKDKSGNEKIVYKYKRKKRFGSSINRRSPATFCNILEDKIYSNGGKVVKVNCTKYKASQYNHITKEATKSLLSNRTKLIGSNLVQRDLYSSFLLYNIKDNENIDFDACNLNFNKFLELQQQVVEEIKTKGDTTKNFGLKDFIEYENNNKKFFVVKL